MKTIKNNYYYIFFFFILIGIAFRYINNFDQMYWRDEAYTLFLSDPSMPIQNFLENVYNSDDSPPLYFYILKLFNHLAYTPENIRLSSIIFSVLTILISINFFKYFLNNEECLYAFIILTFNIFLIWQSKESRIPSSVIFFSILNFICFFKYQKKCNIKNSLILTASNVFTLSYYPFLACIIVSQYFFIILNDRIKFKNYSVIFFSTIILYILLNYDYLISNLVKTSHIGNLEPKFFVNYFFRSFFGTIVFGGFSLIIFSIGFIHIFKNKKNNLIYFNIYLIIISYLFVILYSYFKAGINVPRYFIFLIPSIILIITKTITVRKIFVYTYLILTIINTIIVFDDYKIQKPKLSYLFNHIDKSITLNFYVNEKYPPMNTYFNNSSIIKKNNLVFINKNELKNIDKFYFICLNHPEMHVGKNKKIQDNNKCDVQIENFKSVFKKDIKDFRLVLFENKNIK